MKIKKLFKKTLVYDFWVVLSSSTDLDAKSQKRAENTNYSQNPEASGLFNGRVAFR